MIYLNQIKCPKCQSYISKYAEKCPKCHEWLNKEEINKIAHEDLVKENSVNYGIMFSFIAFFLMSFALVSLGFTFFRLIIMIILSIAFGVYFSKEYKKDNK